MNYVINYLFYNSRVLRKLFTKVALSTKSKPMKEESQPQSQIQPALYSQNLKTSSQTYFFDVKAAKNGNQYLNITQSRINKDGQKFRSTITVFLDQIKEFAQVFEEVKQKVA